MCPFCFVTAAAIAASVVSTGGLTALALLKRPSATPARQSDNGTEKPPDRSC